MHEMSIAESILEVLPQVAPPGAVIREVEVQAGPLRAIDPDAMEWAWRCATEQGRFKGVRLKLVSLPYHLVCPACERRYEADQPYAPCACGNPAPHITGGTELEIVSLDVED